MHPCAPVRNGCLRFVRRPGQDCHALRWRRRFDIVKESITTAARQLALNLATPASGSASSKGASVKGESLPARVGSYEIIALLGEGGMGKVYLAYHALLDRRVALKVLGRLPDAFAHETAASRFLTEAAITGRLSHAGIVPVHSVEYDPAAGYFYTMRYVEGRSLREILEKLRAKDPATVAEFTTGRLLQLLLRVSETVAYAHAAGVVHRDLKPGNSIVTPH